MKSRLITALAIGALAIGMLPAVASADNTGDAQNVTVTLIEGTTVVADASVAFGSGGYPGQWVNTPDETVQFWSNDDNAAIKAQIGAFTGVNHGKSIAANNVNMDVVAISGDPTPDAIGIANDKAVGGGSAVTAVTVDYSGETSEVAYSFDYNLDLEIPSAPADDYSATLTWTVVDGA